MREREEQSCVLMMSHVLPPDRAHSKKTEAQALLPIASNRTKERENSTRVFYQKERKIKSSFPMTFSPFAFDVSHLFGLFNSIRLSIFNQKVHQIRKLAHYYGTTTHVCRQNTTKVVRFASYSLFFCFCFLFIFPGKERTNEAEEVVQVEPQKNVCVWESRKRRRRRRSYATNETRKALTQK